MMKMIISIYIVIVCSLVDISQATNVSTFFFRRGGIIVFVSIKYQLNQTVGVYFIIKFINKKHSTKI